MDNQNHKNVTIKNSSKLHSNIIIILYTNIQTYMLSTFSFSFIGRKQRNSMMGIFLLFQYYGHKHCAF